MPFSSCCTLYRCTHVNSIRLNVPIETTALKRLHSAANRRVLRLDHVPGHYVRWRFTLQIELAFGKCPRSSFFLCAFSLTLKVFSVVVGNHIASRRSTITRLHTSASLLVPGPSHVPPCIPTSLTRHARLPVDCVLVCNLSYSKGHARPACRLQCSRRSQQR